MKTYSSSSWDKEFTGTRAEAIRDAITFLTEKKENGMYGRFTFRAWDDSGFTIVIDSCGGVKCANKWNKSRYG